MTITRLGLREVPYGQAASPTPQASLGGWAQTSLGVGGVDRLPAPKQLRRGIAFQELVQEHFIARTAGGGVNREFRIEFGAYSDGQPITVKRTGRVDVWIDDLASGACTVFEIKATDWDRIAPHNVRRNVYRHQKQLLDYVYTYYVRDGLQVGFGLIYPSPPMQPGLRERIEDLAMDSYGVPVYWYSEIDPDFNPRQIANGA